MCSYTESVNLDGKGRYFFGSIGPSLLERNLHLNHLDTFSVFCHRISDWLWVASYGLRVMGGIAYYFELPSFPTFRTSCGLRVMGYGWP
jgi:hypothetical protein